ncbi:MAG: hypothetical protein ACYC26_04380 [Phycisphaerales bacterium]
MNAIHPSRVPGPVMLILTRDPTGHPMLIRQDGDAAPVMLCRCPHPANRSHVMRRRWLREIRAADVEGRDVRAVDATM